MGFQRVTKGYKRSQVVTKGYKGLQGGMRGYKYMTETLRQRTANMD